jgi:hypothetical protein
MRRMEFIETPNFTRVVTTLLSDQIYMLLVYPKSRKDLSDKETAILRELVKEL